MDDILTEWEYGKGAIRVQSKFIVMEGGKDLPGNIICGGVFSHLIDPKNKPKNNLSSDELWIADLIIIPHYKFNDPMVVGFWAGLRLDQKICSAWGNHKLWGKQLYPIKK